MAKPTAPKYLNPTFDPRMLSIGPPSLMSKNLTRGWIVDANANANTGMKHGIHFLYNPVAVTASNAVDPTALAAANGTPLSAGTQVQMAQLANLGDVSLDLLYDRTYELWDPKYANTPQGKFGCYVDVLAFYFLLGITATGKGVDSSFNIFSNNFSQWSTDNVWQSYFPTNGIAPSNRIYLYIGDKMRFYGTVNSFSVTYSHWNEQMVPARCQVSLNLNFQSDAPSSNANKIHIGTGIHKATKKAAPGKGKSITKSIPKSIPKMTKPIHY